MAPSMARESRRYSMGDQRLLQRLSLRYEACQVPQPCNLDGISMNIQKENSACYFQVQSEHEQTFCICHSRHFDPLIMIDETGLHKV